MSKPTLYTRRFWILRDVKTWLEAERPSALAILRNVETNHERGQEFAVLDVRDMRDDMTRFPETYAKDGMTKEDLDWLLSEWIAVELDTAADWPRIFFQV